MKIFYVFNEQGVCVLTTSDERYASVYADSIEGYYCCDQGAYNEKYRNYQIRGKRLHWNS